MIHVLVGGEDIKLLTAQDTVISWEDHRKELAKAYALHNATQALNTAREHVKTDHAE